MEGTARGSGEGPRHRVAAGALLAVVLACTGCTICPDPFDYSGPVPDGSPPQNDFRARAGGILPLGAAPRPWPPIVKDLVRPDGRPDQMPVIADEEPEDPGAVVSEHAATEMRQTSVLVPEPNASEAGDVDVPQEANVPNTSPTPLLPVPSAANSDLPTAEQEGTDGTAPFADPRVSPPTAGPVESSATEAKVPSPAVAAPPSDQRESPGWRPRRRSTR